MSSAEDVLCSAGKPGPRGFRKYMVVQGTDEKWMSCDAWAAQETICRDVLGFSTWYYVPYYRYYCKYVFQYWNSVPEWRWPVDTLGRHPDSLTLSHARRGDLTTVRLRLGQNPGDGGQSSENTMQIVHKSPRYRQSKFRG